MYKTVIKKHILLKNDRNNLFPFMYEFSNKGDFKFMALEFYNMDLETFRQSRTQKELSQEQAISAALCTIKGLRVLHGLGILHGNIQPCNILINANKSQTMRLRGSGSTLKSERVITTVIWNFNRAVKFRSKGKIIERQADYVFNGPLEYAPLSLFTGTEYCQSCDCYCAMLCVMHVSLEAGLPWSGISDVKVHHEMRKDFDYEAMSNSHIQTVRSSFKDVIAQLQKCTRTEDPNYKLILAIIHGSNNREGSKLIKRMF